MDNSNLAPTPQAKTGPSQKAARIALIQRWTDSKITVPISLSSEMHRAYRRFFNRTQEYAALIRMSCAELQKEEVAIELIGQINNGILAVEETLVKKLETAHAMIKRERIEAARPNWPTYEPGVIDPVGKRMLDLFRLAQECEHAFSVLWLGCKLDDTQHRDAIKDVQTDLAGIRNTANALYRGVRAEVLKNRQARRQRSVDIEQVELEKGAAPDNSDNAAEAAEDVLAA